MRRRNEACDSEGQDASVQIFLGYPPPTSSTTYTPNQLFDVVLPNASRGCLRLVAYLIRKTLGWSDEAGNPQNPNTHVSYKELIEKAGISRGAVRPAIDEAIEKRYIDCLQIGQSHRAGEEGFSALYSLRWDEREEYVTDLARFDGFFAGNGNLTHIPNDFFDYTIANESLAVVKVVGVIIRHTIGWQTRYGMRRQQVALSFTEIMRRTAIGSRTTLSEAIKSAVAGRHIVKAIEGLFDPHEGTATTYAICWADQPSSPQVEPKNGDGSKTGPGVSEKERFKNRTSKTRTVQKLDQAIGSITGLGNGSKIEPASVQKSDQQAFNKRTTRETTFSNNKPKQQQTESAVGGTDSLALLVRDLLAFGIGARKAQGLVDEYPAERIRRQLSWIEARKASRSRTGLLIRSIEEDLPEPDVRTSEQSHAAVFAAHFYAELSGNPGDPVAMPSPTDIDAAGQIVSRIATEDPAGGGRAFARHTREKDEGSRSPVRTLPLASRLFADAYVAAEEATQKAARVRDEARLANERVEREQESYEAFSQETAVRLETAAQDIAEGFLQYIDGRIKSLSRLSDKAPERIRQEMQNPAQRVVLLVGYLREKHPGLVPSLEEWRQNIRREGIIEGESA